MGDFRGGINMEPENAAKNQVLDARNVWAPEGTLEQRPGLVPVAQALPTTLGVDSGTPSGVIWAHVDADETTVQSSASSGTFTITNGNVGDYIYCGFSSITIDPRNMTFLVNFPGALNAATTSSTEYHMEYYTSGGWRRAPSKMYDGGLNGGHYLFKDSTSVGSSHVVPNGWELANLLSLGSRYWFRIKILVANLDSPIELTDCATMIAYITRPANLAKAEAVQAAGFGQARFDGNYMWSWVLQGGRNSASFPNRIFFARNQQDIFLGSYSTIKAFIGTSQATAGRRPAVATLPQFRRMFICYDGDVYEIDPSLPVGSYTATTTSPSSLAQVESDAALVGTNAPYDPSLVAQLSQVPKMQFITSYNGVLFAARIYDTDGGDSLVRWSGAGSAFRVWPEENFADLAEDDNSPITGLTSLNEAVIVFKQDSIWNMEYTGTSELDEGNSGGLPVFTPRKIVSGIGCISNSSIARTPMGLIFLAEDGFYLYDGRQATKISSQIDGMVGRVAGLAPKLASAVYWQTKNAYLCALPIDGSGENNIIFVYDLKHNAWWFWDSTEAQCLAIIEDSADKEQCQFIDKYGRIMQFQEGKDDYGYTPTAYVETHRIAGDGYNTITCREVRVNSEGAASQLSIEVIPDDDVTASSTVTTSLTDGNAVEAVYGDAVYGTSTYAPEKRKQMAKGFRKRGTWFRVKISMAIAFVKMTVHKIIIGVVNK
jgi:hypothetical protein